MNSSVATSLNNIGLINFNEGNYEQALKYYEMALNIYYKSHPFNMHSSIANLIKNIALAQLGKSVLEN